MGASLYQKLDAASAEALNLEHRANRMERLLREVLMDYAERMPLEWLKNAREVIDA